MTKYTIRLLEDRDESILWNLFYYAISVPEGEDALPRSIVNRPELSKYVEGWGKTGDYGFLAINEIDDPIGAVWLRQFTVGNEGYGFVDDLTPELSIAVIPGYRAKGIGTVLLDKIIGSCSNPKISLSVSDFNPALRLYKRFGFQEVSVSGDSITMLLDCKTKIPQTNKA